MIADYLNVITSEHRGQPKYMAMLTAYLRKLQDAQMVLEAFDLHFDLNEAIGAQLDKLGEVVGRSRILQFQPVGSSAVLDDDNYRLIIKAKILQNQWDGTIEDMGNLFKQIFPDMTIEIIDNQNMSMEIQVLGLKNNIQLQMLNNGYIIPKPEGVRIKVAYIIVLEQGHIYFGATTQNGTKLNVYPRLSSEVTARGQAPLKAWFKQGAQMDIYPKVSDNVTTKGTSQTVSWQKQSVKVKIYPKEES